MEQSIVVWKQLKRDERKDVFLNVLRRFGTLTPACHFLKLNRTTVWNWRQADPEFDAEVRHIIEVEKPEMAESVLYQNAVSGDPRHTPSLLALLRAEKPDKYREKLQVDITVTSSVVLGTARGIADIRRERLKASGSTPTINLESDEDEAEYVRLEDEQQ